MFRACFPIFYNRNIPDDIMKKHSKIAQNPMFDKEEGFCDKRLPERREAFQEFKWVGGPVNTQVINVYDGDTVKLGFKMKGELMSISGRLKGIDTPELRTKDPKEKEEAERARKILDDLIGGQKVTTWFAGNDKYGGRSLVHLYVYKNGWIDVSDYMLKNAPCRAYDGGKKEAW